MLDKSDGDVNVAARLCGFKGAKYKGAQDLADLVPVHLHRPLVAPAFAVVLTRHAEPNTLDLGLYLEGLGHVSKEPPGMRGLFVEYDGLALVQAVDGDQVREGGQRNLGGVRDLVDGLDHRHEQHPLRRTRGQGKGSIGKGIKVRGGLHDEFGIVGISHLFGSEAGGTSAASSCCIKKKISERHEKL